VATADGGVLSGCAELHSQYRPRKRVDQVDPGPLTRMVLTPQPYDDRGRLKTAAKRLRVNSSVISTVFELTGIETNAARSA
jgi:hypothetical protein